MNESMTSPIILIFWLTHFNPRSYERSDGASALFYPEVMVSIHAPTKGATQYRSVSYHFHMVSIHAPTKGATKDCRYVLTSRYGFQSTLLRKERRVGWHPRQICWQFQSTLLRKERRSLIIQSISVMEFQSTLLRKERRIKIRIGRHFVQFQSTLLRKERPIRGVLNALKGIVSIHAPTKGATLFAGKEEGGNGV